MFSTDCIFRQQETLVDNHKCQAGFRPLRNEILLFNFKNCISGEAIARENGIRFLETSAKTNVNIDRAFIELSESILDKTVDVQEARQPLPPPNQSSNRSQCCSN